MHGDTKCHVILHEVSRAVGFNVKKGRAITPDDLPEICLLFLSQRYLDELLLKFEDGQTLSLLQDGLVHFLAVRGLRSATDVFLPLRNVFRHHAYSSHVGRQFTTISCQHRKQTCIFFFSLFDSLSFSSKSLYLLQTAHKKQIP